MTAVDLSLSHLRPATMVRLSRCKLGKRLFLPHIYNLCTDVTHDNATN